MHSTPGARPVTCSGVLGPVRVSAGRWPPSRSAISKTPTVFRKKAQGSPLQMKRNSHGFGITHRNRKTLKLRNLRKSGVPWINVSSILFFSDAAHNSQLFVSAPLKNLGSPALRHVDKIPSSQQDSVMKRPIVRGFTFPSRTGLIGGNGQTAPCTTVLLQTRARETWA